MERSPVVERKNFKCEACGVFNKTGSAKCWKCGRPFKVDKAVSMRVLEEDDTYDEMPGEAHTRRRFGAAIPLLILLPPAGIIAAWLRRDWSAGTKVTATGAALVWTALLCWLLTFAAPFINIPIGNPLNFTAPEATVSGAASAAARTEPLNLSDAIRIRVSEALGAQNITGLNRIIGVKGTYFAVNADGDPYHADYYALRAQMLKALPALSDLYAENNVGEDLRAVFYLIGENERNVTVELAALTVVIDAQTVTQTRWDMVTADDLPDYAYIFEERAVGE